MRGEYQPDNPIYASSRQLVDKSASKTRVVHDHPVANKRRSLDFCPSGSPVIVTTRYFGGAQ